MNKTLQTISITTLFFSAVLISGSTLADQEKETGSIELASASIATDNMDAVTNKAEMLKNLKARYRAVFNGEPDEITESHIANVYQLRQGTRVVYLSADGKYFLKGDMIDAETRENLTEVAKRSVRKDILYKQDNKPIVFKAKDEKHVLIVFTDIDCPYCVKLHREVSALNEKGITIKYLMFPRAGIGSASYNKTVSVWCADDNRQALTDAKYRKTVDSRTCKNPVTAQYVLGKKVGVTGTPALITSSGKLIPGYMPADKLIAMLNSETVKQ